jgi:hypothetical protein
MGRVGVERFEGMGGSGMSCEGMPALEGLVGGYYVVVYHLLSLRLNVVEVNWKVIVSKKELMALK